MRKKKSQPVVCASQSKATRSTYLHIYFFRCKENIRCQSDCKLSTEFDLMKNFRQFFSQKSFEKWSQFRNKIPIPENSLILFHLVDLDAGFWPKLNTNHASTLQMYRMKLKMSQLIDGRFKFTKTETYFLKLPQSIRRAVRINWKCLSSQSIRSFRGFSAD